MPSDRKTIVAIGALSLLAALVQELLLFFGYGMGGSGQPIFLLLLLLLHFTALGLALAIYRSTEGKRMALAVLGLSLLSYVTPLLAVALVLTSLSSDFIEEILRIAVLGLLPLSMVILILRLILKLRLGQGSAGWKAWGGAALGAFLLLVAVPVLQITSRGLEGVPVQRQKHSLEALIARIQRFRREQGRMPGKMEDLLPKYLAELPETPLHYDYSCQNGHCFLAFESRHCGGILQYPCLFSQWEVFSFYDDHWHSTEPDPYDPVDPNLPKP